MIADWLQVPYRPFGRDLAGADCWGLVRLVRRTLRGADLPAYGWIDPDDKRELTAAAAEVIRSGWHPADPAPGVIATVWRGGLMIHAGIVLDVDGMRGVLDTARRTGPVWRRLADFNRRFTQVRYYDDD
jgi:cell wall-associated NlpC family hydrolase